MKPFNLEQAKAGVPVLINGLSPTPVTILDFDYNHSKTKMGKLLSKYKLDGDVDATIVHDIDGNSLYNGNRTLSMGPVATVGGKPVYIGDVLRLNLCNSPCRYFVVSTSNYKDINQEEMRLAPDSLCWLDGKPITKDSKLFYKNLQGIWSLVAVTDISERHTLHLNLLVLNLKLYSWVDKNVLVEGKPVLPKSELWYNSTHKGWIKVKVGGSRGLSGHEFMEFVTHYQDQLSWNPPAETWQTLYDYGGSDGRLTIGGKVYFSEEEALTHSKDNLGFRKVVKTSL